MTKKTSTCESEALHILAMEFSFSDRAESERKIKRRLRDKKLGPYDQDRVNVLRAFKDDVQQELDKPKDSRFYNGPSGKYVDPQDWDFAALWAELEKRHPKVSPSVIGEFLPYAIFLYYLK